MLPVGNQLKTLGGREAERVAGGLVPCLRVSYSPPEMPVGSDNPLSELSKASTTLLKATLPAPYILSAKERL